jgi:hypothetical protein
MELIEAREVTAPLSDEAYRGPGRPRESKRKINKPAIAGWHDEVESARRLGEDIRTRGRKRRAGVGPQEWIQEGRHVLYQDGCEEKYLSDKIGEPHSCCSRTWANKYPNVAL